MLQQDLKLRFQITTEWHLQIYLQIIERCHYHMFSYYSFDSIRAERILIIVYLCDFNQDNVLNAARSKGASQTLMILRLGEARPASRALVDL